MHTMKFSDTVIFGNMPRKSPQGENLLREREILFFRKRFTAITQKNSKPTYLNRRIFLSRFPCKTVKNTALIFSCSSLEKRVVVRTVQQPAVRPTVNASKSVLFKLPQDLCLLPRKPFPALP